TEAELAQSEGKTYETLSISGHSVAVDMMSNLPGLPEGWTWSKLESLVVSLRNGLSKKPDEVSGLPILRISAVRPLRVDLTDVRFLDPVTPGTEESLVQEGDLLFTRYNGNPDLVGVCGEVRNISRAIAYPDKLIRVRVLRDLCAPSFLEIVANAG